MSHKLIFNDNTKTRAWLWLFCVLFCFSFRATLALQTGVWISCRRRTSFLISLHWLSTVRCCQCEGELFFLCLLFSYIKKNVTMEHVDFAKSTECCCCFFLFHIEVFCICILTVTWCPQDMCVCAGCDHQDQAGLWGAKTVRLGCSQAQSQDAVARHSRRSGHAADLWTFFSTEHAQSKLRVHQLPPQQRERVSTKYVAHCLCFVTMFSKTIEIYVFVFLKDLYNNQ